jgi:phosphinothricin acetyltransferase
MNSRSAAPAHVRDATADDFPAIAAIYAHHVLHGAASFEETPPSLDELLRRHAAVREHGLPWLVAEIDGRVAGYCYATPYRPRPAYRFCLEDSIYLAPSTRGRGVGRLLLAELLAQAQSRGARQMLAVIGDAANLGSVGVHRAVGFEPAGVLRAAGWKFGRWLDVVLMQRRLGEGEFADAAE